jgi:Tfp pilus assembly protein PilX
MINHQKSAVRVVQNDDDGMILVALIIIAAVLTVIGLSLATFVSSQFSVTARNVYNANASLVAEAGIEQSVEQLNQNDNFAGYPADQEFFNNTTQGRAIFTTTVASTSDSNAKVITSIGKVYRKSSSTVPVSTRSVKVTVVGTGSDGYSVNAGVGGLILGGSANITNSQVFVNGTLVLSGAAKIGTFSQPLDVKVANQACPTGTTPGATYPQVCSGVQPITLAQSTNIYGTVCATGQTSVGPNNNIQGGSTGQGLVIGCTTPPQAMPTYDRAAHIARTVTTSTSTDNTYVCNSFPFNRTWPAHLKLTGSVSIASSCNVVIKGDAYITGDLTIGGAAKITVDESVGTTRPVIVVDGKITVSGSGGIIANSKGTGIQFISFKSAASCAASCTTLSGNDLKSSQILQTISIGGNVNLPGMIFEAYWGKLTVAGSGNIGAALGQTVDLSGAGTITFGTTLSSGARTWTITSYQQKFIH